MRTWLLLGLSTVTAIALFAQESTPVIVDTDAGVDDLMGISFLLARKDVKIEAITIANGLAHVDAGARNILSLLELAGGRAIPVYEGNPQPMAGTAAFPQEWRVTTDELPGVKLPQTQRKPERTKAADYFLTRLRHSNRPVRILALGPLTNLGEALQRAPEITRTIQQITIMGGAIRVPGNLRDGGYLKTNNTTAEWNMFVDPVAARIVVNSGIPIRLVPLDATNQVPIDIAYLDHLKQVARSPLSHVVVQVLESERDLIQQHFYYAWDPLAAFALVNPGAFRWTALHIEIRVSGPQGGRTLDTAGKPNVAAALDAGAAKFRDEFLRTLLSSGRN